MVEMTWFESEYVSSGFLGLKKIKQWNRYSDVFDTEWDARNYLNERIEYGFEISPLVYIKEIRKPTYHSIFH